MRWSEGDGLKGSFRSQKMWIWKYVGGWWGNVHEGKLSETSLPYFFYVYISNIKDINLYIYRKREVSRKNLFMVSTTISMAVAYINNIGWYCADKIIYVKGGACWLNLLHMYYYFHGKYGPPFFFFVFVLLPKTKKLFICTCIVKIKNFFYF